jgi:hypothetical protein
VSVDVDEASDGGGVIGSLVGAALVTGPVADGCVDVLATASLENDGCVATARRRPPHALTIDAAPTVAEAMISVRRSIPGLIGSCPCGRASIGQVAGTG